MDLGLDHLSMSSIRMFLEDRNLFFRKYVLEDYEDTTSQSMFIGLIVHEYLGEYYTDKLKKKKVDWKKYDKRINKYIKKHQQKLSKEDQEKITSIKNQIEKVIEFYKRDGNHDSYEPILVEKKLCAKINDINGNPTRLPVHGILDILVRGNKEKLVIVDHKIVQSFSEPGGKIPYLLQAYFYFFLVYEEFGEYPVYAVFDEIKKSKNKNELPQVKPYVVIYRQEELELFQVFYDAVSRVISGQNMELSSYLPNPYHFFSGQNSWQLFVENQPKIRSIMYKTPSK